MTNAQAHPSLSLSGRHALVTGGGRGIGAAIAEMLARQGAQITLLGRTTPSLKSHAKHLNAEYGAKTHALACDITDESAVRKSFLDAFNMLGPVYILVNNAGEGDATPFSDITRERWDHIMAVNLTGTYLCSQQVLPGMLAAKAGRIVNIASTASLKGYKLGAAYCAAKHGVLGMTRALALETARHNITVNAVCPSYTDTDMTAGGVRNVMDRTQKSEEEALQTLLRPIPTGRLTRPEEVAATVAWLCSNEAAAITGAAIPVAGGEVM